MPKRDSPSETLRERNGQAEIWTPQQFASILAELRPNMRALFAICYYCGCRVSEARPLSANPCQIFPGD